MKLETVIGKHKLRGLVWAGLALLASCSSPAPLPGIRVTPAGLTLSAGGPPAALEAVVSNSTAPVRWAISPNLGSLDRTGGPSVRYTPPARVDKSETVILTAALEGTGVQTRQELTVHPPTAQALVINPSRLSLTAGDGAVSFGVGGASGRLSCAVQPALGGCRVNGTAVEYTPPASVETPAEITLTVGLEGSSAKASARLTVGPRPILLPGVRLSPGSLSTRYGAGGSGLSATVVNSSGTVTWSLSPELGTLSTTSGNTVVYTPPHVVGLPTSVTVTASLAGTPAQSVGVIHLQAPDASALECSAVDPVDNQGVVGYVNRISFLPGQAAEFKTSTPAAHPFHLAVYRDGQQSELVYLRRDLPGLFQAVPAGRPYRQDLGWATTASLTVPDGWRSGLYRAKVVDSANQTCYSIPFVVKNPSSASRPPVVVLANNFTWQAYNDWGGASFYKCAAGTCDNRSSTPVVTFARPSRLISSPHLGPGTRAVTEWLERQGYAYDLIADSDLDADPAALEGYRILVLPRHSEYWSEGMRDRLDGFLARGRYLVSLGGNQIYWKVVARGDQLEVKKYPDDRQHTLADGPGGLWRDLGRPEAGVLGNQFTAAGMGSANLAPYRVVSPDHWALAGTALEKDQTFGAACSGWETDKADPAYSPGNLELIARGTNADPGKPGQAGGDMVYYNHAGGGGVFSAGSLAFFSDACRDDPAISRITRNVFDRFLGR